MKEQLLSIINSYGFDVVLEGTWAGETIEYKDYINDDPELVFYGTENPKTDKEIVNLLLGVLAEINNEGVNNIKNIINVHSKYDELTKIYPTTPWNHQAPRVIMSATETPIFEGYTWTSDAEAVGYITIK
ncbi:TPA: hypothetical protein U1628_000210 [Streptococcus suis]|nr:hypothetical protein [Streptococcus suis]HEM5460996.1 hypothetical protein [Streptococcus suis]